MPGECSRDFRLLEDQRRRLEGGGLGPGVVSVLGGMQFELSILTPMR
jgi:hypothetical protein